MSNAKLQKLAAQGVGFAIFPDVQIFDEPGGKGIQHLLFGDVITPPKKTDGTYEKWTKAAHLQQSGGEEWVKVRSRQDEGWIRLSEVQTERTLEVNFVDVGQGDGVHVVTPTDEHFVIDAGVSDNMYRFLRWRFNLAAPGKPLPKFSMVISHPDQDHFQGFVPLLAPPEEGKRHIEFDTIYYNGIVQRSGSKLGETGEVDNVKYLLELMNTDNKLRQHLRKEGEKSLFEKLLISAIDNQEHVQFHFASSQPGQEDLIYEQGNCSIRTLAPVPQKINGKPALKWLTDVGKTKNGHSVVLMLNIGKMKIFLGGDLNSPSADYLMEQYSGIPVGDLRKQLQKAKSDEKRNVILAQLQAAVEACRKDFQADIAKSCHHGSSDVTNELLQIINPIATVISSGDEEGFCHPRPETLGAVGKYSRGDRPLLYATELSRSSPEFLKKMKPDDAGDEKKQRLVSTYGMISVRTDGERAIIAQKLEKEASNGKKGKKKWQIEKLIWEEERQEFRVELKD